MIVYTAVTNGKDSLKTMPEIEGVTYVAFSDKKFTHPQWEYRELELEDSPRMTARKYKALSHRYFPDEETVIWVDGSITFNVPPNMLVDTYLRNSFIASRPHRVRKCIYQELDAVEAMKLEEPAKVKALRNHYTKLNYPRNLGLAETGLLIRLHNEECIRFNEEWWYMIKNACIRDQCSFDYIHWKNKTSYDLIPRESINVESHKTERRIRT